MKKVLFAFVAAALTICSCTKGLEERVGTLEDKVAALEQKVNANVTTIEQLLSASARAVTITSVVKGEDSYTVNFSDGTTVTLKDGLTPALGVREIDGVCYWTVNGELLKYNGANVPVKGEDGLTPQFKITDGVWKVSFDGTSWTNVPVEPKEISLALEETAEAYIFTIGEVKVSIAKDNLFTVKVSCSAPTAYVGQTIEFTYTITGADESTYVYVESKGYDYKLDKENQKLYVTLNSESAQAEYIVLNAVRNSDGKKSAQYILVDFESRYGAFGGVIITDNNPYTEW